MNRTDVETIKERLPINEVVGQYVKLEKAGSSYKGRCPFHNEKTPSFFVSPDRGGYYCFGCGAKGDIFTFVEQFEGLDFRGALKVLAERAGVTLSYDKKSDGERDRLLEIMETVARYFEDQYARSKEAQEYVKKRGISEKTREEFRIGWAPEGWSNLKDHLVKKGYQEALIEKAGLIKRKSSENSPTSTPLREASAGKQFPRLRSAPQSFGGQAIPNPAKDGTRPASGGINSQFSGSSYDRFRGRIIFPICDSSGRVIAFSGRILPRLDDGKGAKYLNSPDTPLYDKSRVLYGLDKAKTEIRRLNYSILVEGQMDLVMSHQAGIRNTVASSGTALTVDAADASGAVGNLELVRRLSANIVLAFDSDKAGRMAAMRAVAATAIALGMAVKIADIEGGKDPADIILADPETWREILKGSKHVIEYELGNILSEISDPHKIGRTVKERIFPYLARMDSEMDKAFYVKMIADRTKVSEQAVWDDVRAFQKNNPITQTSVASSPGGQGGASSQAPSHRGDPVGSRSRLDIVERRLFGLMALMDKTDPTYAETYRQRIRAIAGDTYEERMRKIEPSIGDLSFEAQAFYGEDPNQWRRHVDELIINFEEDMISEELVGAMKELKHAEQAGDVARIQELANKCKALSIRKGEVVRKR